VCDIAANSSQTLIEGFQKHLKKTYKKYCHKLVKMHGCCCCISNSIVIGGLQKKLTQTNEKMHGKTCLPAYHKFAKLPFVA
jgi:hypothetical protein